MLYRFSTSRVEVEKQVKLDLSKNLDDSTT